MRGALAAVVFGVASAGCYAPTPPAGAPCSSTGACPDGLVCVAQACRAPGSAGPDAAPQDGPATIDAPPGTDASTGDRDLDGIPDAVDNCPDVANPDQHDEDADGRGDLCDHCPGFPSTDDPDGDGDGVGDACDPHPQTPGDKMILFEGFATAPAQWTSSGPWTFVNDEAIVAGTSGGDAWLAPPLDGALNMTAYVQVQATAVVVSGSAGFGVAAPFDPTTDDGIACDLGQNANGQKNSLFVVGLPGSNLAAAPIAWKLNQPALITLSEANGASACSATQGSTSMTANAQHAQFMFHQLALRTKGISARYAWVMWVTSP